MAVWRLRGPTPDLQEWAQCACTSKQDQLWGAAEPSESPALPALQMLKHPGTLLSVYTLSLSLGDLILSPGFKHLYADNFPIYIFSPDIPP